MQNSEALLNGEELFRLMADTAPVLIWMAGVDSLCTYFNRPWLEFTGRELDEELGNGWAEGVHPDDFDECFNTYMSSFNARQKFEMEYRLRRADGQYRWILDNGVPRNNPDGSFAGYIGSCIDITERKEAEEKQRIRLEMKARQQAVIVELGLIALSEMSLKDLMQKTTELVAQTLNLDYCSATEFQPEYSAVLIRAGYGWEEGIVGQTRVKFEPGNWVESSLHALQPSVINNWATETHFPCPSLLSEHNIHSSLSIKLEGLQRQPFGTLVGHTVALKTFIQNEINFFQSAANILSAAIQRNQTATALQQSEERFRVYQELTLDHFVVLTAVRDGQGKIIDFTWEYLNPISEKSLGGKIEDFRGKRVVENYPTTITSGLFDTYVQVIETGLAHQMETHYEGEGFNNWFRNVVVKMGDGVAVTAIDITSTKKIEQELTATLERERNSRQEAEDAQEKLTFLVEGSNVLSSSLDYTTLLQSLADLTVPKLADWCTVHIADEQGIPHQVALAHVNPEKVKWAIDLQKKLGERYPYDPDGPTGLPNVLKTGEAELYPDISDEMLVAIAQNDENFLKQLRDINYSSVVIVPLIARGRVLGALQFVSTESGKHYDEQDLAFAKDLAQRAAIAVDNARLYHEAQQSIVTQKEVDYLKDLFFSVAGHELRTPLTSIRGYAQIMERNLIQLVENEQSPDVVRKIQVKTRRYLENIVHQTDQMNKLISQLMDFTRLQNAQFDLIYQNNINQNDLILRVVEQQRVAHSDSVIITQLSPIPVYGSWDESRIEQVLNNLISNAIKYSPVGSPVVVALESQSGKDSPDEVVIWVKDQGQGINPEEQQNVFDRFYRARSSNKRSVEGLGLGLYICHEIVSKHGGRMWLESEPNVGSTFYFSLPLNKSFS